MFEKENLDKRICGCKEGCKNTHTARDIIRDLEEELNICPAPIDDMTNEEYKEYLILLASTYLESKEDIR